MAILSVNEVPEGKTIGETAAEGATGVRVYRVISDDQFESPAIVMNATGVPLLGDVYPGSFTVRCTDRTPSLQDPQNSRMVWLVTCSYKSILSQDERDRAEHPNPLDRKARIVWKSQKVMRTYRRAVKRSDYYRAYGTNLESTFSMKSPTNSASDPFEPVLEYPATEWVAVISKNINTIPDWFLTYEDAVNDADFTIQFYGQTKTIKKGCAKLGAIALPTAKQENGTEYVQLSFEIIVRSPRELRSFDDLTLDDETVAPEPFDDEIIDAGLRRRIVAGDVGQALDPSLPATGTNVITALMVGLWMNITDAQGYGVTLPVPFDGYGKPIGTPGFAIAEDKLVYSLVAPYKRKDFGVLAAYLNGN